MHKAPIQRTVDEAVKRAGSLVRLGKLLGISRQAIQSWTEVPPKHVLAMEELSGVSRYEIRPDIYGEPPKGRPSQREVSRAA